MGNPYRTWNHANHAGGHESVWHTDGEIDENTFCADCTPFASFRVPSISITSYSGQLVVRFLQAVVIPF
jgi:hypothetical protein